jgi:hypothetical protein
MTQEELASELLYRLTGHCPGNAEDDYQAILDCFKAIKNMPAEAANIKEAGNGFTISNNVAQPGMVSATSTITLHFKPTPKPEPAPKRHILRCLDCGDIIELTSPRMLVVCYCGRSSICSWHKPSNLAGNYEDLSE